MAITLIDPPGVPTAQTHRQVAVATGSRTVYVAGQVAWGADGSVVGAGDLAAQIEQCLRNVATALAGVGATLEDVAKLTVHVVDWSLDMYPAVLDGIARASAALGASTLAPASLLSISAGFTPEILVEVEAVAVLD